MEIEVLGIGDAFTARRYNTSFLLRSERAFLIDAPPGLFRILAERNIDRREVNDVILTHLHADHVSGLETLALWKKYAEQKRIRLYTSPQVFEQFTAHFFGKFRDTFSPDLENIVSPSLEDYIEFIPLAEGEANSLDSSVALEIRHNWHPIPTLGLKFLAFGAAIGISGDTCYRPSLLRRLYSAGKLSRERYEKLNGDWLWNSDVIYHEADRGNPKSPHTLEEDLLKLPEAVRERIRLVHVSDHFEEGPLPVAREGEKIVISPDGKIQL